MKCYHFIIKHGHQLGLILCRNFAIIKDINNSNQGSMSHIRQMSLKPLQLKAISTQHCMYWKVVDFLQLKMICSVNATIFWRNTT